MPSPAQVQNYFEMFIVCAVNYLEYLVLIYMCVLRTSAAFKFEVRNLTPTHNYRDGKRLIYSAATFFNLHEVVKRICM